MIRLCVCVVLRSLRCSDEGVNVVFLFGQWASACAVGSDVVRARCAGVARRGGAPELHASHPVCGV